MTQAISAPEKCPDAHKAIGYYHREWHEYLTKREALRSHQAHAKPRNCGYARYLAKRWQRRARAARDAYERWWADRGQVISRLDRGLANAGGFKWMRSNPMRGLGAILERHGRRYGVSPYFMVATAATESSMGLAACSNNRYNVWGLASCKNSWHVPAFQSWDEAVAFYARFLSSRWPGHSTPYSFRGYAACSECWARKVSYWMGRLFGVPAVTRYP